ncbi:SMP-30/gluconolactonase/LRE family protein [Devosia marina]|uniref:SMP-30/Gluconolactonase/LRE-like region domain-containing protein n=1 Tax=Devosia marina TaxID=2683198 RepID=A0A7X3FQP4_9HYPH|nr:hypothetical protein [Devosia marina]
MRTISLSNALAGGGGLALLEPGTGSLANFIGLPMHRPIVCAFGGQELSTLFVTSARFGLDACLHAVIPGTGSHSRYSRIWQRHADRRIRIVACNDQGARTPAVSSTG